MNEIMEWITNIFEPTIEGRIRGLTKEGYKFVILDKEAKLPVGVEVETPMIGSGTSGKLIDLLMIVVSGASKIVDGNIRIGGDMLKFDISKRGVPGEVLLPQWKVMNGVRSPFKCRVYIPGDGTVDGMGVEMTEAEIPEAAKGEIEHLLLHYTVIGDQMMKMRKTTLSIVSGATYGRAQMVLKPGMVDIGFQCQPRGIFRWGSVLIDDELPSTPTAKMTITESGDVRINPIMGPVRVWHCIVCQETKVTLPKGMPMSGDPIMCFHEIMEQPRFKLQLCRRCTDGDEYPGQVIVPISERITMSLPGFKMASDFFTCSGTCTRSFPLIASDAILTPDVFETTIAGQVRIMNMSMTMRLYDPKTGFGS